MAVDPASWEILYVMGLSLRFLMVMVCEAAKLSVSLRWTMGGWIEVV
jgi:hypothetical protein